MYRSFLIDTEYEEKYKAVDDVINKCWSLVREQRQNFVQWNITNQVKIVRVFVSSTFTDFHNEREVLVKRVFPTLREICESRGIAFFECDLRWGVPPGTSNAETIATCMDELERCHLETGGQPFFINLLGDRYGWIPTVDQIPSKLAAKYNWIPNTSITFMEMMYGALRCSNSNAAFFVRKSSFLSQLSDKTRRKYQAEAPLKIQHLKVLKREVQKMFPSQYFEYDCSVEESNLLTEKVVLTKLDEFEKTALHFLISAVDRMYPKEEQLTELPLTVKETQLHEAYWREKCAFIIGRDKEEAFLMEYITKELSEDRSMCLVTAKPGYGKSSLLASVVQKLENNSLYRQVCHFVGASGRSTDSENMLKRLLIELSGHDAEEDQEDDRGVNVLQQAWTQLLAKPIQPIDVTHVVVIDALNEVVYQNWSTLSWLVTSLPSNLRLIVSCSSESGVLLDHLRTTRHTLLELDDVTEEMRLQLVTHFYSRYAKRLNDEQLNLFVSHEGAASPLWMLLACEEVRVHGNFRTVTDVIKNLPSDIHGLLRLILARLVEEDTTKCLKKALVFMHISKGGVPEEAFPMLLGDPESPLSLISWATVRRHLKPFIKLTQSGRDVRLRFFHQSVHEVVRALYIQNTDVECHQILANYYLSHYKDQSLVVEELAYHMKHGQMRAKLLSFLRRDFASGYLSAARRRECMLHLRCKNVVMSLPQQHDKSKSNRLMLCRVCSLRVQQFSPTAGSAATSCWICGNHVFLRKQSVAPPGGFAEDETYQCNRCAPFGGISDPTCEICKRPTFHQGTPVLMCHFCRVYDPRRCAQLIT